MVSLDWARKLSLLSLCFFFGGWIIYSVGFCWKLAKWRQDLNSTSLLIIVPTSHLDPLNFPYYVVLVTGPFVFVLGLLHTVLPSVASSIAGLVTGLVGTFFSIANGWVVYSGGLHLKYITESANDEVHVDLKLFLMYGGALFAAVCWCVSVLFSISYNYTRKPNTFGLSNYNQIFSDDRERSRFRKIPFTPGVARIFTVPFIVISATGWCVFVAGVDKLPNLVSLNPKYPTCQTNFDLSLYGSIIVGPFLYLAALLHAGCLRGASTVMGVFTSILQTVYIVFMGFNTLELGRYVYFSCKESPSLSLDCSIHRVPPALNVYIVYAFAGGVSSLLFWSIVVAMWPLFRKHLSPQSDSNSYNIEDDAVHPLSYGTMQLKESVSYSGNRSTQHPRQSLIIAESNEHK